MTTQTPKTWWIVKGKITSRFGSIVACAHKLECSPDALRKATLGRCPGVAARLKTEIGFDWEESKKREEATAA